MDGFGLPLDDPNAIPRLVPGSTIHQIAHYVQNHQVFFGENLKSFAGKVGETEIRNALVSHEGIAALFPPEGTPGLDLYVPSHWLEARLGIPVAEGVLQVKTVNSPAAVLRHFEKYPDIPVIAPDHVVEDCANSPYHDYLIPFSSVGADDYHTILATTSSHVEHLAAGQYGDVIHHGVQVPELADHADAISSSVVTFPKLAVTISAAVAIYRNYKLVQLERVTIPQALQNVLVDTAHGVAKAAVGLAASGLAKVAVTKVAVGMGVAGGLGELAANAYDGVRESMSDGLDLGEVFDIGEAVAPIALAVYGIYKVGSLARGAFEYLWAKGQGMLFEFRVRKARKLEDELRASIRDLAGSFATLPENERRLCEDNIYGPHYRNIEQRLTAAQTQLQAYRTRMGAERCFRLFPPIHFFFIEHAAKRLSGAMRALEQQRGQIVREYLSLRGEMEIGEFLYRYHKTVFDKIAGSHTGRIHIIEKVSADLAAEISLLRKAGVLPAT